MFFHLLDFVLETLVELEEKLLRVDESAEGSILFHLQLAWKHQEGGLLYVEADSSGADSWKLSPVVDLLKQGAVGVIPTDTVYVALLQFMSMLHHLSFLSIF
jgi:hypothetical protein